MVCPSTWSVGAGPPNRPTCPVPADTPAEGSAGSGLQDQLRDRHPGFEPKKVARVSMGRRHGEVAGQPLGIPHFPPPAHSTSFWQMSAKNGPKNTIFDWATNQFCGHANMSRTPTLNSHAYLYIKPWHQTSHKPEETDQPMVQEGVALEAESGVQHLWDLFFRATNMSKVDCGSCHIKCSVSSNVSHLTKHSTFICSNLQCTGMGSWIPCTAVRVWFIFLNCPQ